MNLQEQLNRIQEMMGINPDNERKYIDWDENYGKTFKIVKTPEGRQSVGEWNPDLISIVTPENTDAWTDWEEISNKILRNWKQNWDDIQKSLGQHKYDQIIRSQKMLSEGLHDTSWENEEGDKITCKCDHSWKLSDGGNDPYLCHKCGHDNSKTELTEKCWKGYTQKGMKTMFGKRHPNCVKKTK